ncbi:hypothetical protein HGRIS_002089 [Hohenbuehelia grisea]|uniref:Uncharacterized protein n=1 Tax=Hohenbuehelia grisea TaxID=104357 RepID=A0ABR3JKL5_9AGAR
MRWDHWPGIIAASRIFSMISRIILCRHDPQVSEYIQNCVEQGRHRRQHLKPGKAKVANPKAAAYKRTRRDADPSDENEDVSDRLTTPAKRRRKSADQHLILVRMRTKTFKLVPVAGQHDSNDGSARKLEPISRYPHIIFTGYNQTVSKL